MDINEFLNSEPAATMPLDRRYSQTKLDEINKDLKAAVLKERAGFIPQSNRALARFFYSAYQVKISPKTVKSMLDKLRQDLSFSSEAVDES